MRDNISENKFVHLGMPDTCVSIMQTLGESLRATDINYEKLKVESERLERHTKAPNWWIWLMLAIVCMIFISMILFIRIFPKAR